VREVGILRSYVRASGVVRRDYRQFAQIRCRTLGGLLGPHLYRLASASQCGVQCAVSIDEGHAVVLGSRVGSRWTSF
jgi:hypothetical protein